MSERVSKLLAVVLLTLLIWAWAYMSQEQPLSLSGSLEVASSVDESLLVTFSLMDSDFSITKVPLATLNFKGPPSRTTELVKQYNLPPNNPDREGLTFYYAPSQDQPEGTFALDLLAYLREQKKTHELALTLESCRPEQVEVHVEKLEKKKLPVQVLDENGSSLPGVTIEPPFVTMYARKTTEFAKVMLTERQKADARKNPINVTPYVDFGIADITRFASEPIKVSLLQEDLRKQLPFQPTLIGFIISPKLSGRYTVELLNESSLKEKTLFYATEEARNAYEKMRYHILIEIRDGDELLPEIEPRPVIYNFPRDYFKNGDIDVVEENTPKTALIKLVPVIPVPSL